jgi:hypothetical protein
MLKYCKLCQASTSHQPKLCLTIVAREQYCRPIPSRRSPNDMVRAIGLLCLALMCSHQVLFSTAVMARPDSGHDKNLPRRALMSANANQVLPAAAWTLALAGLEVVQTVAEGQLPVHIAIDICPQGSVFDCSNPDATKSGPYAGG